jgi:hypothetical protein
MGQRFVACDREQSFLMPPDVREWLPERHLAWFVIDAVAEMDLDGFYAAHRVDGRCRPPYDPAMMVALLLYAYEAVAYIGGGPKWSVSRRVICFGALSEGLRTAHFGSRSGAGWQRRTYPRSTASLGVSRPGGSEE